VPLQRGGPPIEGGQFSHWEKPQLPKRKDPLLGRELVPVKDSALYREAPKARRSQAVWDTVSTLN